MDAAEYEWHVAAALEERGKSFVKGDIQRQKRILERNVLDKYCRSLNLNQERNHLEDIFYSCKYAH